MENTIALTPLMTAEQLAGYLNVKKNTVRVWTCTGKIPYVKVGRLARYELDKVKRWLNRNTKQAVN